MIQGLSVAEGVEALPIHVGTTLAAFGVGGRISRRSDLNERYANKQDLVLARISPALGCSG